MAESKTFAVDRVRQAGVVDEGRRVFAVLRDAIGRDVRLTIAHAAVPHFALRLIAAWRSGFAQLVQHGHRVDPGVALHGWSVWADRSDASDARVVLDLQYPELVEQRTTAWPVPFTAVEARQVAKELMRLADELEA